MIGTLHAFALDCRDPAALAGFYAGLVGGKVVDEDGDNTWVELIGGHGTTLAFQLVEDHRAPEWPGNDVPQQTHVDVAVPDLDAAQAEVLALGARLLEDWAGTRSWRVFADPAGHPFCLCLH